MRGVSSLTELFVKCCITFVQSGLAETGLRLEVPGSSLILSILILTVIFLCFTSVITY
jgi:hypothetical protein